VAACSASAPAAQATTHDFCNYDGTLFSTTANVECRRAGTNLLTQNYSYLPYAPSGVTISCGARYTNNDLYGGFVQGSYDCTHNYPGTQDVIAVLSTTTSTIAHGYITY